MDDLMFTFNLTEVRILLSNGVCHRLPQLPPFKIPYKQVQAKGKVTKWIVVPHEPEDLRIPITIEVGESILDRAAKVTKDEAESHTSFWTFDKTVVGDTNGQKWSADVH